LQKSYCGQCLFPEQIWDSEDISEYELYTGKATGGAMPLVWAHSEYLKLCRSLKTKQVFDMPAQTYERYITAKTVSNIFIWNFKTQYSIIPKGKILRIECLASAIVKWTTDNWATANETKTLDSCIGNHFADIPTSELKYGHKISFTFYWIDSGNHEHRDYQVSVESDPVE
jgi:glucoamylase